MWCCNLAHPHSYDYNKPLSNVQLELLHLQCHAVAKQRFTAGAQLVFCASLSKRLFQFTRQSTVWPLLFGSTLIIKTCKCKHWTDDDHSLPYFASQFQKRNQIWYPMRGLWRTSDMSYRNKLCFMKERKAKTTKRKVKSRVGRVMFFINSFC